MFRTAELGSSISKDEYSEREPLLRQQLLDLQRELRELGRFPVVVVFAGVDGAGKGACANLLSPRTSLMPLCIMNDVAHQ